MENIICFFSGTGNSLSLAREIAAGLGDTELINISGKDPESLNLNDVERLGFIFPVYYGCIPPIMRQFIEKLTLDKSIYIFGVVTRGGLAGPVQSELADVVASVGGKLSLSYSVMMPGNYIAMYGAMPEIIQRTLFDKSTKKAAQIAEKIKVKLIDQTIKDNNNTISLRKKVPDYLTFSKDFRITHNCTGCKLCFKICPSSNITMVNNKPHFDSSCQHCMACIQWCPTAAITYKDLTPHRSRYRHPGIKAEELYRERG
jgi:ferredoxin